MNKHPLNPNKLLLSKWTAVQPKNKEKHFLVTRLIKDEQEVLVSCVLEAIINHHEYEMDWRQLTDTAVWQTGWN